MTDEAKVYTKIEKGFASHETVNHSIGEYVRGDAHTNTAENYFSILKRGITGILRVGQVRESLLNLFERSCGPLDRMLAMWKVRWCRAYDQAITWIFACRHGFPAGNPVAADI